MSSGLIQFDRFRPYRTFWCVTGVSVLLDWLTKVWVTQTVPFGAYFLDDPERQPIIIFSRFWIVHVGNKGAAWGLGAQQGVKPLLIFLALAVLALIWRWRKPLMRELTYGQLAFGLFVGGTIGNVLDRLLGDHVIDFIDIHLPYYRFPAFNVADSCICVGVGLYLFMSYREDGLRREAMASHAGEDNIKR
ncbi:MAG: signal peptidase II [Opitutae bacterium]